MVTFTETVKGIIGAGSLICQRIAAYSPVFSAVRDGSQRVIRFAKGTSTKRSQVEAEPLIAELTKRGVAQLSESETDELWLVADASELRKPYAQAMPDLMQVRDLKGKLVPGYRTLNVLGMTPSRRGILYHRLFSSVEEGFVSEPKEVRVALETVSEAIGGLKERMAVTWILDRGFDDVADWRTIWEQEEHLVCRIHHRERLVAYGGEDGLWKEGKIADAGPRLTPLATAETEMVVQRGRQTRPKRQKVEVTVSACPLLLRYDAEVRRGGHGDQIEKQLWLVEVRILKTNLEPWLLITDWPVEDEESAVRIFRMYRQRWAVEDSFKFTKEVLGWEEVQLLDLGGIRTLVALAWVAAGFLYELGVALEWEEVKILARLGGWVERPNRPPGKITLVRGLHRVLDMLATQAFLQRYRHEHGALSPRLEAWLFPPKRDDPL
jgi:hypothetical protein